LNYNNTLVASGSANPFVQIIQMKKNVCLLLFLLVTNFVFAAEVPRDRVWYVTDFGAVGDGKTLNTVPLQATIDTCNAAGGGTVRLTPGTFLSGTLFLKDNVTLSLDAGAVLLGSENKDDYTIIKRSSVHGEVHPAFHFQESSFLLYAENVKNIAIEGKGEINGSGEAFYKECIPVYGKRWRPRGLVCFFLSQHIVLRDITLKESPCYTSWSIACEDVNIDGIRIKNPWLGINTDGLGIDCCRRVTVANCIIEGGDDAIAIKSDSGILGDEEHPCENITITNCVLKSRAAGLRLGYEGDSIIRNCTFSNITIYDSMLGLSLWSYLPAGPAVAVLKGSRVENILFSNIAMRNVDQPIFFKMGNELPDRPSQLLLRDIRINNVIADECRRGCYIGGFNDDKQMENISLSNITLNPNGKMPADAPLSGTNVWNSVNPYAQCCQVKDSSFFYKF
jgi:polygalacturonase